MKSLRRRKKNKRRSRAGGGGKAELSLLVGQARRAGAWGAPPAPSAMEQSLGGEICLPGTPRSEGGRRKAFNGIAESGAAAAL